MNHSYKRTDAQQPFERKRYAKADKEHAVIEQVSKAEQNQRIKEINERISKRMGYNRKRSLR